MPSQSPIDPAQAMGIVARALLGRVSIPLSLLRSRVADMADQVALEIQPDGRGVRIDGEAHALGAPIDFAATIEASGVRVVDEQRLVTIRLSDVSLTTSDDAPGPLAEAIRTGQIDTSNPGTLVGNMVALPDMIVSAEGQEVVVDLLKVPAVQENDRLRAALAAATSYIGVTAIEIANDAIVLQLGLLPGGAKEAVLSTARAALMPAVRYLWPEGTRR